MRSAASIADVHREVDEGTGSATEKRGGGETAYIYIAQGAGAVGHERTSWCGENRRTIINCCAVESMASRASTGNWREEESGEHTRWRVCSVRQALYTWSDGRISTLNQQRNG